jgi:hypothetical protein
VGPISQSPLHLRIVSREGIILEQRLFSSLAIFLGTPEVLSSFVEKELQYVYMRNELGHHREHSYCQNGAP